MKKFIALLSVLFLAQAPAMAVTLTKPGDPIIGFFNTSVGGNSTASTAGGGTGQFPAGEPPANAIDNNTGTKYLNFGTGGGSGVSSATKGVGTGFFVTPSLGLSILTGVQVVTANDDPNRDPLSVSIEGSNGGDLSLGSSWSLIGTVNLGIDTNPGRFTAGPIISLPSPNAYSSYRVIVQSQRGSANSVQYSEFRLLGNVVPEPASLTLLGLGGLALLRRRRLA